jgi:RimJ/RimL family protein N-acetyltransferase
MAAGTADRTAQAPIVSLVCTPETFMPAPDPRVRWFNQETDFALARESWEAKGLPLTRGDWHEWHRQGYRYCGIVEDQRLVAFAAAWEYSPTAWELAAVQTREGYRSQGFARAVCSFVTAHVLASGRRATCSTRIDNVPMLRVATNLGFRPLSKC